MSARGVRANDLDVQAGDGGRDIGEDRISIMQEIRGRLVVWEGIAELLRRPGRCGMRGDGRVDDPSTVVREDDEHEEHPERSPRLAPHKRVARAPRGDLNSGQ